MADFEVAGRRFQRSTGCRSLGAARKKGQQMREVAEAEMAAPAAEAAEPDPPHELTVMAEIDRLLERVDQPARRRILRWAADRWLGPAVAEPTTTGRERPNGGQPGAFRSRTETVELARELGVICDRDVAARYGITLSGARQRLYSSEQADPMERVSPGRYVIPGATDRKPAPKPAEQPSMAEHQKPSQDEALNGRRAAVAEIGNVPPELTVALVGLGYARKDARAIALETVRELGQDATLESLIRHSLRQIGTTKTA